MNFSGTCVLLLAVTLSSVKTRAQFPLTHKEINPEASIIREMLYLFPHNVMDTLVVTTFKPSRPDSLHKNDRFCQFVYVNDRINSAYEKYPKSGRKSNEFYENAEFFEYEGDYISSILGKNKKGELYSAYTLQVDTLDDKQLYLTIDSTYGFFAKLDDKNRIVLLNSDTREPEPAFEGAIFGSNVSRFGVSMLDSVIIHYNYFNNGNSKEIRQVQFEYENMPNLDIITTHRNDDDILMSEQVFSQFDKDDPELIYEIRQDKKSYIFFYGNANDKMICTKGKDNTIDVNCFNEDGKLIASYTYTLEIRPVKK